MPLIECPNCGKKVSDKAKRCPNCGISFANISLKTYPPKPMQEALHYNNNKNIPNTHNQPHHNNNIIIVVIALAVVIISIISGGIYVHKKNIKQKELAMMKADSILRADSIHKADSIAKEIAKYNGHKYVDLGLSVKWATCNIGANTPEEAGGHYCWADPTGENTTCDVYDNASNEGHEGDENYCGNWISDLYGGVNPPRSICGTDLDIAKAKWGGSWRLPTHKEMEELFDKCKKKWVAINGIYGIRFIGPNKNEIFIPAVGYSRGNGQCENMNGKDDEGWYWTGTLYEQERIENGQSYDDIKNYPCYFCISYSDGMFLNDSECGYSPDRCTQLSIRPVAE